MATLSSSRRSRGSGQIAKPKARPLRDRVAAGSWPGGQWTVLLGLLLGAVAAGCHGPGPQQTSSPETIHYTAVAEGEVWFRNSLIQLRFDRELYCGVFFRQKGRLLSLSHNPADPTLAKPSHFIAVQGSEILDFYVDYQNIGLSEVRSRFGPGKRLHITGYGETDDGIFIEKTILVELYEAYPDTAMMWAVYRNLDPERPLQVTRITNQFFRLDASLSDPEVPRYALQCYHQDRLVYGQSSKPLLDLNFRRTVTTDSPGFARVAAWNRVMGMTVASRPPQSQAITIPVRVARDQRVEVSFEYQVNRVLEPDESLICPKGFVMVYSGDYHTGLARQEEMMSDE